MALSTLGAAWLALGFGIAFGYDGLKGRSLSKSQPFCRGAIVHDYLTPLRGLPPLNRLPKHPMVRVGYHRLSLRVFSALVVGPPREVGFGVEPSVVTNTNSKGPSLEIVLRLSKMTVRGRMRDDFPERQHQLHVRSMTELREEAEGLQFKVGGRPALYRVDMRLTSGHAQKKFSEYFRVVRRKAAVSLSTESRTYRPGDVVRSRIENWGTAPVVFGYAFKLDQYASGRWMTVKSQGAPAVAIEMSAGLAWGCTAFRASDLAPGRYRIRRAVRVVGGQKSRMLSAAFEIIGRSLSARMFVGHLARWRFL